ncbi:MAG: Crp/Fnr family transcriptional regulator [Saprospiraceae bacterium]|jgi:CRP/FNR family transcriptional regulator|nr:Crp/Fnr family transcriptional regulator [Saprospiraceae bacterium]
MPPSIDISARTLRELFPAFDQQELADWLVEHMVLKHLETDRFLIQAGGIIRYIPLVLAGSVKVSREGVDGREIFLYYILPGQTCAMTLSTCFKGETSRVTATMQETGSVALFPAPLVHEATRRFPAWQRFVFDSFGHRYDELLQTLESVVFRQLDERLLLYLREKAAALQTRQLHISQQQIANDLNASREVISRLIRQFEQKGILHHARGTIELFSLM